jgi:hypothetical protein
MNAEDIARFHEWEQRLAEAIEMVDLQDRAERADKLIADLATMRVSQHQEVPSDAL